jgi:DNA-binding FadR family transcriptional regulator
MPRVPRAEAVARDLEAEILGGLAPGERLGTKEDLRQRYGVAVATVNEAVRLLEMRGLIEARPGPGGGVFAAESSVRVALKRSRPEAAWGNARYEDCLAVRNGLEPLVCRDAARHRRPEDLRELERIVADMERHASDPAALMALNWAFHRRVAKMCRNAPLHSIYLTLIDFLEDGLRTARPRAFEHGDDVATHRELVAAIGEGPGPRLEAAIERHARLTAAPPRGRRGARAR